VNVAVCAFGCRLSVTFSPPCKGSTQPLPLIQPQSSICLSALLPAQLKLSVCTAGTRQQQWQVLLKGLEKQYTQDSFSPPCVGSTQPLAVIQPQSSICFSAGPAQAVCLHCRYQAAAVAGCVEGSGEAVQPGQLQPTLCRHFTASPTHSELIL